MIKLFPIVALLFSASPAFADDVAAMLTWGDRIVAKYGPTAENKQPGASLDGLTTDRKPCSLVLIGSATSHRQYTISLGASSTGTPNPGYYSWIDTVINPEPVPSGYQLHQLVVGIHAVIINVSIDVSRFGETSNAQNYLEILTDSLENVTLVSGSSSALPSLTCLFKPKP
ncbi:hypothetical protein HU675_0035330 [Bradyrhizobium septentrionale]|uniref:hypothetical protein n=1 Tax=Bradyrhizobium septentrionale TaxID=1404411 RepID=UPI001596F649|nr:hypothetical protein [Bradyrhizobium septentrionale]UGY23191.1 hypothetical protein HU675_0035330 [Bradyrhizobium septentrionale]